MTYIEFDDSQRNEEGFVTIKSLAEVLNKFVADGKGDYEVLVDFHKLNECVIDSNFIDLCH